jgi:hypothetical protein
VLTPSQQACATGFDFAWAAQAGKCRLHQQREDPERVRTENYGGPDQPRPRGTQRLHSGAARPARRPVDDPAGRGHPDSPARTACFVGSALDGERHADRELAVGAPMTQPALTSQSLSASQNCGCSGGAVGPGAGVGGQRVADSSRTRAVVAACSQRVASKTDGSPVRSSELGEGGQAFSGLARPMAMRNRSAGVGSDRGGRCSQASAGRRLLLPGGSRTPPHLSGSR